MGLLDLMEKIILKLEKIMILISGLIMFISIALQVIFRFIFSISVSWTEEISIISFIVMIFYSMIHASYQKRHLGVSNIVDKLDEHSYKIVWFIKNIIINIFLITVMLVGSFPIVIDGLNQSYPITRIPLFYIFIQIPIFALLVFFHTIMAFLRKDYLKEITHKKQE